MFKQNFGRAVSSFSHKKPFYYYLLQIPHTFFPWIVFLPQALYYALRSGCLHRDDFCRINENNYAAFEPIIQQTATDDVPALYIVGSAWATWIQFHRDDWNAVAQLAQVKAIMARIIELDEAYKDGRAHVYLGAMATLIPPAMGGDPETGRRHFDRALMLSGNRDLMIKVIYARQYARMLFNRELHDKLLNEVLAADPRQPELTLMNTIAQQQARELLQTADDYF